MLPIKNPTTHPNRPTLSDASGKREQLVNEIEKNE